MHNYFIIEHNYLQYVIYNFKPELKFCEKGVIDNYFNDLISQIIILYI